MGGVSLPPRMGARGMKRTKKRVTPATHPVLFSRRNSYGTVLRHYAARKGLEDVMKPSSDFPDSPTSGNSVSMMRKPVPKIIRPQGVPEEW